MYYSNTLWINYKILNFYLWLLQYSYYMFTPLQGLFWVYSDNHTFDKTTLYMQSTIKNWQPYMFTPLQGLFWAYLDNHTFEETTLYMQSTIKNWQPLLLDMYMYFLFKLHVLGHIHFFVPIHHKYKRVKKIQITNLLATLAFNLKCHMFSTSLYLHDTSSILNYVLKHIWNTPRIKIDTCIHTWT